MSASVWVGGRLEIVDVYPVGALSDLRRWRTPHPDRRHRRRVLRSSLRYLARRARARDWRAVKNYCNGYLAEPRRWPSGLSRCGSGWTERRALRDLRRRLAMAGL